jgi:hypothetical protein
MNATMDLNNTIKQELGKFSCQAEIVVKNMV